MARKITTLLFLVIVAMSLFSATRAAEDNYTLKNNPFSNPHLNEMETAKANRNMDFSETVLELRGTMVAGKQSQANIGGQILALGDNVDGYRLVAVEQRTVVLVKNGAQKILALDPDGLETRNE